MDSTGVYQVWALQASGGRRQEGRKEVLTLEDLVCLMSIAERAEQRHTSRRHGTARCRLIAQDYSRSTVAVYTCSSISRPLFVSDFYVPPHNSALW